METLNLIKNDPWLEPYADAINGRHKHAAEKEAELIFILACIALMKAGFSANGLPMPLRFSWLERLMTGKRRKNTA